MITYSGTNPYLGDSTIPGKVETEKPLVPVKLLCADDLEADTEQTYKIFDRILNSQGQKIEEKTVFTDSLDFMQKVLETNPSMVVMENSFERGWKLDEENFLEYLRTKFGEISEQYKNFSDLGERRSLLFVSPTAANFAMILRLSGFNGRIYVRSTNPLDEKTLSIQITPFREDVLEKKGNRSLDYIIDASISKGRGDLTFYGEGINKDPEHKEDKMLGKFFNFVRV